MKKRNGKIIGRLIIVLVLAAILVWFMMRSSGPRMKGTELFPDTYWEEVTEIIFYDFDECTYSVSEPEYIDEIKNLLTSLTYKEVKNPELEGWGMFDIHTENDILGISFSRDFCNIEGVFYHISDEGVGEALCDYIKKTTRSGYPEFENTEDVFKTIESYPFHNSLEEFEREVTYTDPYERSTVWGDFETYYYPTNLPKEYILYEVILAKSSIGFLYLPVEVAKGGDAIGERDYYLFVMSMGNTGESWLFTPDGTWEYFSALESLREEYEIEEVKVDDLRYVNNTDCGWEPY